MLRQLLVHSKMNQSCIYIHPLPFEFPSHSGHYSPLNRVPCAAQQILISYLFYAEYQWSICVHSNLQISFTQPTFPLGIHIFVLYVCVYLLQVRLSISFFQVSRICYYMIFVFKLLAPSLCDSLRANPQNNLRNLVT